MAKRKGFKTMSGYLNNMSDQISRLEWRAQQEGKGRKIDVDDQQRQSINNLLSQLLGGSDHSYYRIKPDETPRDGVDRMCGIKTTDPADEKRLREIQRWFKRQKTWIVTGGAHSVVADGKVTVVRNDSDVETRRFSGISRKDRTKRFVVVLDVPMAFTPEPFKLAEEIAGPDIAFVTSMNIRAAPDSIKGRLLTIDEYYAAMPEEAPREGPYDRQRLRKPRRRVGPQSATPERWR